MIRDPGGPKTSTWRTHRLCLESIRDETTHLLVIQDDGLPCDRFAEAVTQAVSEQPGRIVCLFTPGFGHLTRRVNLVRVRHGRWLEFPVTAFVPLVAVVYPREHALGVPVYADALRARLGRADDGLVAGYVRSKRIGAVATVPSLVQHRDELPSVMRMPSGKGAPHRLAAWWEETPTAFLTERLDSRQHGAARRAAV